MRWTTEVAQIRWTYKKKNIDNFPDRNQILFFINKACLGISLENWGDSEPYMPRQSSSKLIGYRNSSTSLIFKIPSQRNLFKNFDHYKQSFVYSMLWFFHAVSLSRKIQKLREDIELRQKGLGNVNKTRFFWQNWRAYYYLASLGQFIPLNDAKIYMVMVQIKQLTNTAGYVT